MIRIVQIGSLPIVHLNPESIWGADDLEAPGKLANVVGSIDSYAADEQFIARRRRVQLTALIHNRWLQSASGAVRLRGLVGATVWLVGYAHWKGQAVWVENYGRVASYQGSPSEVGETKVRMEVELADVWRPLNRLYWQYGCREGDALYQTVLPKPAYDRGNVFPNAFELTSTSHTGISTTSVTVGSSDYRFPYFVVVTQANVFAGIQVGRAGGVTDHIQVTPGQQYTLSIWIRGVSNFTGYTFNYPVRNSAEANLAAGQISLSSTWTRYDRTFIANDDFISFLVTKNNDAALAEFQIGGFALVEGSTSYYDMPYGLDDYPPIAAYRDPYPTLEEWQESRDCCLWQRRSYNTAPLLNPNAWRYVTSGLPDHYPVIGQFVGWNTASIVQSVPDFGEAASLWNADPLALYAFRGLFRGGNWPTITVQRWDRPNTPYSTTINLGTVNFILTNETTQYLKDDDVLLVGAFNGRVAVFREGAIAAYAPRAILSFSPGLAPGAPSLKGGTIQISSAEGEWAALFVGAMA